MDIHSHGTRKEERKKKAGGDGIGERVSVDELKVSRRWLYCNLFTSDNVSLMGGPACLR